MNQNDKDKWFLEICIKISERGTCPRKQVGAITVLKDKIIGTGFNGSPKGIKHCNEVGCEMLHGHCIRSVHAEVNSILYSKQDIEGATLYANLEPCLNCVKFAINAGITRVIYLTEYGADDFKYEILKQAGIEFRKFYEKY